MSEQNSLLMENDYGRVQHLSLSTSVEAIAIKHQLCTALISLHGGQVLEWQPCGEHPVFWLSEQADYHPSKAIRGGAPVCWPWFAAGESLPTPVISNHGLVRTANWQLHSIELTVDAVNLILELTDVSQGTSWSGNYRLQQRISLGKSLSHELHIENIGDAPFIHQAALHNYFQVSNTNNIKVDVLNQWRYFDKLTGEYCDANSQTVDFTQAVDRIYQGEQPLSLYDHQWQRQLNITPIGASHWVVWNPADDASAIADLHPGGEREFVCLEVANLRNQQLLPGQSASIGQCIELLKSH